MTIWTRFVSLDELESLEVKGLSKYCGIVFTGMGDDWIEASMPLDSRTADYDGYFHAGALSILAETVGSVAASLCIGDSHICVGQSLSVSHPVHIPAGPIKARASASAVFADSHIWTIDITDAAATLVAKAQLTMAVLEGTSR